MGWTLRVLRHRAAAQSTLLAAVLAVALVGATLLGTFALLLHTSENDALGEALGRAPAESTELEVVLTVDGIPVKALDRADTFLDDALGDIGSERSRWLTSNLVHVGEGSRISLPMAYLASSPAVPEHATLVAGAWPDAAVDARGRIPVAVPKVAADTFGWEVGTVLPTLDGENGLKQQVVVVGVHVLEGPGSLWQRDVLGGAQYNPSWPIPGSFGQLTGRLYGPFVVVPEALVDGPASMGSARVVAALDLDDASAAQVRSLQGALADGQARLSSTIGAAATSARIATPLPATIDEALGNLAVTRVGVVVVGLMLVVLAVTVLLLAARLLAERRAAEQTLMASRGASTGQLLRLAALEGLAVATVAALAAPWLARLLYDAVTRIPVLEAAGLHDDPGTPATLWLTCVAAATLLAGVLLQPLLRRRGSVVDAEQQLVRQDRRGVLARSGIDVALLALAALGVWQLQGYRSPVLAGTEGTARLDPVLVAAPALLLLAGAVLALRVVPLVAGLGERLASRSRSLVAPLGAWEVARRPGRATGAVLLLTIAVAVASFAQSFLGTWRTSQQDQADLAVGTDLRIDQLPGSPLEQTPRVAAITADLPAVSPVTDRDVAVGAALGPESQNRRPTAALLAVDTRLGGDLLRGRSVEGWDAVTEPLRPENTVEGVPLPGNVAQLLLDVASTVAPATPGEVALTVVLEDDLGVRTPVAVPLTVPLGEAVQDLRVDLPVPVRDATLVAVVARVLPVEPDEGDAEDETPAQGAGRRTPVSPQRLLTLDVTGVRAVATGANGAPTGAATAVPLTGARWESAPRMGTGPIDVEPMTVLPQGDGLRIGGTSTITAIEGGTAQFSVTTFGAPTVVPAVVSDTLARQLRADVGDQVGVDLGDGRAIPVEITRVVPYLPGHPRGVALLVDRDLLTRATLAASFADPMLDEWWAQVPDDEAASVAQAIAHEGLGEATTRAAVRAAGTDGPLRIGVQAALWVVTVAALALAFAGFAMSATVSVRTRRLELARLQALGASRGGIVRAVLVEHAVIGVLGVAAGLAIGGLLASVLGPLLTVSAQGRPPVPYARVEWDWAVQAVLVGALVTLVALAVGTTTNALLRRASGALLRLGDER